ncbi:plant intracellular Ras-group-related LRR protein 5-like [Magnolia sinica]|uniref:plant intracellular Ras-group-related LRR protein 5-like n=1 Tax=Magnolia sinica TaxID=86752 RepID=UPI00265B5CED|nr:plant intracellular Ras-group-related LRR protein 5-like [Magnolia sinica]
MAIPSQPDSPAVISAVDEITRICKSLPSRPTIDDVDAAMAVIGTVDAEEERRLDEISRQGKPPDVPEELFFVLQEVKKNNVLLQSHEQKKEALYVVELDKRLQAFDELIQRASKLVSSDTQNPKEDDFDTPIAKNAARVSIADESLSRKRTMEKEDSAIVNGSIHGSFRKSSFSSGQDKEKLSLIKVAGLIETSAKTRAGVLDLQGKLMDQIEWLPVSIGKLSGVTDLNLSENRIMALPSTISSLRCLIKLDIHSNQLINLPDSFGELSNLIDLDLHANQLRSLPASFGNLTNLANLNLSSNQLSVLPDSFGNLTSLRRLNVDTNELEELPYTIGFCISLVELRLDFNRLRALPEAIGKLVCLEIVTLHYNRIKGLPTTMGSLAQLKELDVSFNELESVPENLCFATNLTKLNVGRNFADLRSLPRSIGNLEMLEELDISNNQIRILPDSFRLLSKLRVFYADETPLEIPPREIVKLGAQAVVEYMANFVAKRNVVFQPAEKKKGFWNWLCLLFHLRKKNPTTGMISTQA